MFPRLFKRSQPSLLPVFSSQSLHLSEKVQWLASKGLLDPLLYVHRHMRGDWGDVGESGRRSNLVAITQAGPLHSRYRITPHLDLVVVTDESRKTTIIQLPEELMSL